MAVTITLEALARELGAIVTDGSGNPEEPAHGELTRRLAVATALVERYAPSAPEALQNEACVRVVAYGRSAEASGYGAWRKTSLGGSLDVEHAASHAVSFRTCGAAALLAPWRVPYVKVPE